MPKMNLAFSQNDKCADQTARLLSAKNKGIYQSSQLCTGLENCTRPLVFTSASGCRASENFDISSEN